MNKLKLASLIAVLALILAPGASTMGNETGMGASSHSGRENPLYANIFAQEASSTPGQGFDLGGMAAPVTGPFDNLINKWFKGGGLKTEVQGGLQKAQGQMQKAAGQASDTAQQAARDAISRQIEKQTQEAKSGISAWVENIKISIQDKMGEIKNKIKIFFKNFKFKSKADTYLYFLKQYRFRSMGQKEFWTIENLKEGFEKFFQENSRYPSAVEIDSCKYLPSARQLQRKFGGVPELRKLIGLSDLHFGSEAERNLETKLIEHFGEPFVHIEKPISKESRRIRYDFFVYAKDYKFGVDIFWSDTRQNIMKNLDSKINSYKNTTIPMYLVLANQEISQEFLNEITKAKYIKPIPPNARLVTLNGFLELIKQIKPLKSC